MVAALKRSCFGEKGPVKRIYLSMSDGGKQPPLLQEKHCFFHGDLPDGLDGKIFPALFLAPVSGVALATRLSCSLGWRCSAARSNDALTKHCLLKSDQPPPCRTKTFK